jgi:1-acyl-sn-glycerol-3-phosphate acyltransferase
VTEAAGETRGQRLARYRRRYRYWIARVVVSIVVRCYLRVTIEGRDRLPAGPAVYCFNHLSWGDPFVLMAVLPFRPRLSFFGPKEEDMRVGFRNRVMRWTGTAIPYKPGKNDLLEATRRVSAAFREGGVVAIAGEGRIHLHESALLPLSEGAAYFALRSGVPLVPVAIHGTSWIALGRRVRIEVGEPIEIPGRPTRQAIADVTDRTWAALHGMVVDEPDRVPPGRFGRWLTDVFNEWPEGSREAATHEAAGGA